MNRHPVIQMFCYNSLEYTACVYGDLLFVVIGDIMFIDVQGLEF